jgi:hypothetical protein
MKNNEKKFKKYNEIKILESTQVTWLTTTSQYEIGIRKIEFQKKSLVKKKTQVQ